MTEDKRKAQPLGTFGGYEAQEKIEEGKRKDFRRLPTSAPVDYIMKTMGAKKDVDDLAIFSRPGTTITAQKLGDARRVSIETPSGDIVIELGDVEKIVGNRRGIKKMFCYCLTKINEQAYRTDKKTGAGILTQGAISFTLKEMVEAGLYSDIRGARRGATAAIEALTSLKIKGKQYKGNNKRKTTTIEALEVLFTGGNISKGVCTFYLNERINWGFICAYYTILPQWAYSLPLAAFDLLYTILYLARQNVDKISKQGCFSISLQQICARLGLPDIASCNKIKEKIMQPIEDAITAIEEARLEAEGADLEFTITPSKIEAETIRSYLENGYLEIRLAGEYATNFIAIAENKAHIIEEHKKLKAKAKLKAYADHEKQKLKELNKQETE